MAIYVSEFLLILIVGLIYRAKKIDKKCFLIISFFIMTLVLSLRGNSVGEDTNHFLEVFYKAQDIPWKNVFSGFDTVYDVVYGVSLSIESGYVALNKLIGLFTTDGQWLLAVIAFMTCGLVGKFISDNFDDVFFPTYIFLCESLYMNAFNLMRQILALAIGLQAYTLIKKKKYKLALFVIFLAFLFHKSILLLVVLFPLSWIKKKQKAVKYVAFAMVAFNLLLPVAALVITAWVPRYASYFTTNYWSSSLGGIVILWLVEAVLCFLFYRRGIKDNEIFVSVSMTILYIGFEIIGLRLTMFSRIALAFRSFLIFLFPFGARLFAKNSRAIYYGVVMTLMAILFFQYAGSDARAYTFFWQ